LQPSTTGKELQEAFRPIRNGIGQLLLSATRENSGIALIDYPASRTLAHASDGYEIRDLQEAWVRMLEGLGYQFDVLDGRTLSGMDLKPYRVLIAPGLAAIDDGQYDAIQRFCESGGHLIADGPVGTHDNHARLRPESFSVEKATEGETEAAPFLQLFPEPYPATALLWDRLPEIAAYLDASGCKRLASGLGPANLLQGEAAQWTYDGARIWGLLTRPSEEKSRISIDLPFGKDDVVYDLLSGEQVERPHRADVTLHAGQAALFAALPYEVADIAVLVTEAVPAGQRLEVTAMLETKGGDAGEHFFHIALTSADGQTLPFHDRVLRAPGGRLNTYLPVARNRPPGLYTLRVRDVLSGVVAAAEVVIASAPE
jgi:hypothetical protein